MDHATMTDDLDRRLRAARPPGAEVDPHAFDAALLASVRTQPIQRRRHVPRAVAVPVAVGVTVAATAAVMLAGPGDVGGPSPAAAITQTLRWLDPPAGTILHVRSVETEGTRTTTRELWQSAAHPQLQRERIEGARTFEVSGDTIYDPATDTIYDGPKGGAGKAVPSGDAPAVDKRRAAAITRSGDDAAKAAKIAADRGAASPDGPSPGAGPVRAKAGAAAPPTDAPLPAGDPIVTKVRMLMQMGRATVVGRERRAGAPTWVISLNQGAGRPAWRLWVDAQTGRPIELRDPGRDPAAPAQVIRWTTYEVLGSGNRGTAILSLTAAHPSARVVHDPAQWQAAEQRLFVLQP